MGVFHCIVLYAAVNLECHLEDGSGPEILKKIILLLVG